MAPYTAEPPAHRRKHVRFSGDDSSEPSLSDRSALIPTSVADESTDASNYNSDTESELSESSEEPSDDSSSEEEDDDASDMEVDEQEGQDGVVNLRANRGKKPTMKLDDEEMGPDIRTFLKDFLPQLKAANEELEAQKQAGTLKSLEADECEEGEPYIEMDLGLGVLEAEDSNACDSLDSDSDRHTENGPAEKDVLGKLMGREKKQEAAGIEVVYDTTI